MRFLLTCIFLFFVNFQLQSQAVGYQVEYSDTLNFREGLYLHFRAWKCNAPINKEQIISLSDPNDPYFYEEVLSQPWVSYYNSYNEVQRIKSSKVFGYCRDNLIFTRDHDEIRTIGAICMFTEVRQVTELERTFASLAFPIPPRNENARFFVIDFEYNRKLFFNRRNLEEILARDPALYEQYLQTKGRWRDKIHQYIVLYNQRHPIHFPVYE